MYCSISFYSYFLLLRVLEMIVKISAKMHTQSYSSSVYQMLIRHWDVRICLDILGHWLDLMNTDGWIPREQILGAEALRYLKHPVQLNAEPYSNIIQHSILKGHSGVIAVKSQRNLFFSIQLMEIRQLYFWFCAVSFSSN